MAGKTVLFPIDFSRSSALLILVHRFKVFEVFLEIPNPHPSSDDVAEDDEQAKAKKEKDKVENRTLIVLPLGFIFGTEAGFEHAFGLLKD